MSCKDKETAKETRTIKSRIWKADGGAAAVSGNRRELDLGEKPPNPAAFQYKTLGHRIGGPDPSARGCAGDAENWKPGGESAQGALDAQLPFPP